MKPKTKTKTADALRSQVVLPLLSWFSTNARDLPWRRTSDPYAIWVSEIMLQQTQVKTVIPFWNRWMRELPDIPTLAAAPAGKIHKLWEGLGYYTRVRNLQKAAQTIVSDHHSRFPTSIDDILSLPGIGRYTAGAICSIAFNQPTPILDGNVIRVLTRLFGIHKNPREKATNARLWRLAQSLVSAANSPVPNLNPAPNHNQPPPNRDQQIENLGSRPSRNSAIATAGGAATRKSKIENSPSFLNQSLMELGALICTPRQPKCDACPIRTPCVARRKNLTETLPNLDKRPAQTQRTFFTFVIHRRGRYLVHQLPAGVVNSHLWEFPSIEVPPNRKPPDPITMFQSLADQTDPSHRVPPEAETGPVKLRRSPIENRKSKIENLLEFRHSITRYRITQKVFLVEINIGKGATPAFPVGRWFSLRELHRKPLSSAHAKIRKMLGDQST